MGALNELGFWLRSHVTVSAPAWKRVVSLDVVRPQLDAARLEELERDYPYLSSLGPPCSVQDWKESLYVLDVLDRALPKGLPEGRCLDVGSKNGAYLPGLVAALPRGWDACELDAHRRYAWGSTRRAYGERMAAAFPDCAFHACDVRELEGPWAVVTWFLPFLSEGPLDAWGLPRSQFSPVSLFTHVVERLVPGGVLLLVHQGQAEAELQRALLEESPLVRFRSLGRVTSTLSPFSRERFGFLAQRR